MNFQEFLSKSVNESSHITENSFKVEKHENSVSESQFALKDITNQFAKRESVSTERSEERENIFSTQDAFGSERLISVPSLKEKMSNMEFEYYEKVSADNFSFRKYKALYYSYCLVMS